MYIYRKRCKWWASLYETAWHDVFLFSKSWLSLLYKTSQSLSIQILLPSICFLFFSWLLIRHLLKPLLVSVFVCIVFLCELL